MTGPLGTSGKSRLDNSLIKIFSPNSSSDVKLGDVYVDRLDRDREKERNDRRHNSWVFLFQEAVQELEDDPDTDIRVLMKKRSGFDSTSSAEEKCICNEDWKFGCIAVLSVASPGCSNISRNIRNIRNIQYFQLTGLYTTPCLLTS